MKDYRYISNATLIHDEEKFVEKKEMRYRLSQVSGGIKINGKIMLPLQASVSHPVPAAVLCHGYGADQNIMESAALLLVNKGIATIVFDLRGHGSSEGSLDGNFDEDVIDAWKMLTNLPEVDSSRVALIGHSLGALAAILAAKTVKPKALVALSCPYEMKVGVLNDPSHKAFPLVRWTISLIWRFVTLFMGLKVKVSWGKFLESWSQMKLSSALAELDKCDKLFVFSEGDIVTPYSRFIHIYEKAADPKQKMLTKGSHLTPLEAEILRLEWVGWVVSKLVSNNEFT